MNEFEMLTSSVLCTSLSAYEYISHFGTNADKTSFFSSSLGVEFRIHLRVPSVLKMSTNENGVQIQSAELVFKQIRNSKM